MGLFDSGVEKGRALSDLKKYVGDFKIVETKNAKGKTRRMAVYTGVWTVIRNPGKGTSIRIWAAPVLAAALLAAYGIMLMTTHLFSAELLVMIPLLAGLFPVLYLMMGATSLPFRGKPMRRDQYMHGIIRCCRSSVAVAVFAALGLLAALVLRAVRGDWSWRPEDWRFIGLGIAVIAAAAGILLLLRSVDVIEKPNEAYESKPVFPG